MKKICLLAVLSASLFVIPTARAVSFSDVQLWSGSGTNQAALVINWTDGTSSESLLWGYRWNGTATGEQMLYSVMATDPRLYAEVSGETTYGTALFGLGYDLNNDHSFAVSPTLSFDSQHLAYGDYSSTDDSRIPVSAGDLWQEGWNNGYWSYWLSTGDRLSADFSDWNYSGLGITGRELTDGDWDGWSFAPGFNGTSPSMPNAVVPVPEPTAPAIILFGSLLLVLFRKKPRSMTKACLIGIGLAALLTTSQANAASLDDIQLWTGTGTNRAVMVVHWSSPEVRNNTLVPNPAAEKSLAWGFRWNGTASAEDMFNAVVANDNRLFAFVSTPFPWGRSIFGIGYDSDNNGVVGAISGTNVIAKSSFTNGLYTLDSNDADSVQSFDAADLFWSGWSGPYLEMWQEHGGAGGFTNAPDRGTNPYWTPDDPTQPYSGHHGQWDYATTGPADIQLKNGSWVGWTVAAGGLNFLAPEDPGTIAYDFHKHAPAAPEAAPASPYAVQVVVSQGPFGASPYDDPTSVLGAPSTRFYESASKPATRVKLVEPAYSTAPDRTNKLIVTLNNGSSIIAKFNQPVYDNPANPYGIDFLVFGNAFYSGGGFSSDAANMNTFSLGTGGFYEPTKVSVSPGYTGQPGEDPANPATWQWYRYETGPYGDSDFPTQAYKWDRTNASWTDEVMDFTKPVNPAMRTRFSAGGLTAADGIDLYDGSGGGTGFDLKESGFSSIQYVKVEGISPGFSAGEIDALSIVRPMTVGDELTISPANLTNTTAQLFFQKPGNSTQNVLSLTFTSVSDIAKITTSRMDNPATLSPINGSVMNAIQLGLSPVLGTSSVTYQADVVLSAGNYVGNGSDLQVLQWDGTNWTTKPFVFSSTNNAVIIQSVTNLSSFVVAQLVPPQLSIHPGTNGFVFSFTPMPNRSHTLERSTDFITWSTVTSFTATNAQPMTLEDNATPASNAFYRLRLNP